MWGYGPAQSEEDPQVWGKVADHIVSGSTEDDGSQAPHNQRRESQTGRERTELPLCG